MSDLATLFQYAPGTAAFTMGQNSAMEMQMQEEKKRELQALIQKAQQEMRMAQEKQPLELQKLLLENQTEQARLPGIHADSKKRGLEAQEAEALLPNTIASKRDEMGRKTREGGMKEAAELARQFRAIAGELRAVEPMQRSLVFNQWLDSTGFPRDHPAAKNLIQMVQRTHPERLPDLLNSIASEANRQLPAHQQQIDDQKLQNEGQMERQKEANKGAERVANINAGSRERVASGRKQLDSSIEAQVAAAKGDPVKIQSIYQNAAAIAGYMDDKEKMAEYNYKAAQMESLVQRVIPNALPPAGKADPREHGIGTNPDKARVPVVPANKALAPASAPLAGQTSGGVKWRAVPTQ